jgi:hypothetical protein
VGELLLLVLIPPCSMGRPSRFFRGELLTEWGLAYRREMVQSVVLFFIAGFAVALVVGLAWLALR